MMAVYIKHNIFYINIQFFVQRKEETVRNFEKSKL